MYSIWAFYVYSLGAFYMCVFKKYYLYILQLVSFMCLFNNKFQIAPVVVISGKTCSVSDNNLDTG